MRSSVFGTGWDQVLIFKSWRGFWLMGEVTLFVQRLEGHPVLYYVYYCCFLEC